MYNLFSYFLLKTPMFCPQVGKIMNPEPRSPVQRDIVSENYLKKNEEDFLKKNELNLTAGSEVTIGMFDVAYARKGQANKIKRLVEKQKKRAEKMNQNKKYQGFGDTKDTEAKDERSRRERREQRRREQVLKKAQVTRQEADLMRELMIVGQSALEKTESPSTSQLPSTNNVSHEAVDEIDQLSSEVSDAEAIRNFEESQTINEDSQQNLSEELDKLFELE